MTVNFFSENPAEQQIEVTCSSVGAIIVERSDLAKTTQPDQLPITAGDGRRSEPLGKTKQRSGIVLDIYVLMEIHRKSPLLQTHTGE